MPKTYKKGFTHNDNAKNIGKFIQKEIPSDEKARRKAMKENMYKEYLKYRDYSQSLKDSFKDDKKLNPDVAVSLMKQNERLMNDEMFFNEDLNWESSEVSRRAMAKFTKMVMKNDYNKLKYYAETFEHNGASLTLKEVMNLPVPPSVEPQPDHLEKLKEKMQVMSERLKKLDDNWHINSSEFKKMKEAYKKLDTTLKAENIDYHLLGEQLENLQAASMEYIQKKGVGTQSTVLGQDRMDFALDICQDSADFMDIYCSKERRAELKDVFEKAFGDDKEVAVIENFGAPVYDEEIEDYEEVTAAIEANRDDDYYAAMEEELGLE